MISPLKQIQAITNPLAKERYLKCFRLPQDIRQIFFATETADRMYQIGQKNALNETQLWHTSYATGLVLLGETHIGQFVETLRKKCALDEEKARTLARDINQEIFLPLKESLKKVHRLNQWPREDGPQVPANLPRLNGNIVNLKNT